MSALFNVVPRKNPGDPTAAAKFYISLIRKRRVDLEEIIDRISQNSTLSRGEIKNVIESLEEELVIQLLKGNSVDLGKLGNYRLTVSSDGVDSEEEASITLVKGVRVRHRANSDLANKVKSITLQRAPHAEN